MHELRTVYTLDDLLDFHDAIDEWDAANNRPPDPGPGHFPRIHR